jgi:MFS family permease
VPSRAGDRSLTRKTNQALLAIVGEGFLSRLSFGMVAFALPLYARELGLSLTAIGVLASLNMMVALALKPLMGVLADRVGLKLGLSAAILARSAVTALFALATVPWHLFGARALHGFSIALRDPSVNALIAEHGGKKAIAQSFAWYQTAKSVGGSLSKVAAGVLITLTASNFSIVFMVAFAMSLAPVLVVLRYVREPDRSDAPAAAPPPPAGPEAPAAAAETGAATPTKPPTLRFAGAGLLIGASTHMLNTFFPILATEYAGLSAAQAGALYTVGAAAALAGPAFGWLSDNVSRTLVLQVRSAANVVSSVLYLVLPSLPGFAAGRLLDDLGKAAFKPAWGSMMAHVSSFDRRRRAQIMGTISSGEDAGEMLGPILAGLLWATGGVALLLGGRIALAVTAEVYTAALGRLMDEDRAEGHSRRRVMLTPARVRRLAAVPPMAIAAGLWAAGTFDRSSDGPGTQAAWGPSATPAQKATAAPRAASRRARQNMPTRQRKPEPGRTPARRSRGRVVQLPRSVPAPVTRHAPTPSASEPIRPAREIVPVAPAAAPGRQAPVPAEPAPPVSAPAASPPPSRPLRLRLLLPRRLRRPAERIKPGGRPRPRPCSASSPRLRRWRGARAAARRCAAPQPPSRRGARSARPCRPGPRRRSRRRPWRASTRSSA